MASCQANTVRRIWPEGCPTTVSSGLESSHQLKQYIFAYQHLSGIKDDPTDAKLPTAARQFCRFPTRGDTNVRSVFVFIRQHAQPKTPIGMLWDDQPLLSDVLEHYIYANVSNRILTTTLRILLAVKSSLSVADAASQSRLLPKGLTDYLQDERTLKHFFLPLRVDKDNWLICHFRKHGAEIKIYVEDTRRLHHEAQDPPAPLTAAQTEMARHLKYLAANAG